MKFINNITGKFVLKVIFIHICPGHLDLDCSISTEFFCLVLLKVLGKMPGILYRKNREFLSGGEKLDVWTCFLKHWKSFQRL